MTMRRMFWPACDECGTETEDVCDSYASTVRERLKEDGWRVGNRLVCPSCLGTDPDYWSHSDY